MQSDESLRTQNETSRLILLEERLQRLQQIDRSLQINPNTDISSVVNDCKEIVEEILENYDLMILRENEAKSPLTRLMDRFSEPDTGSSSAKMLALLRQAKEEFLTTPEEFSTKDGEFADLVRGLIPYLIKATVKDIRGYHFKNTK